MAIITKTKPKNKGITPAKVLRAFLIVFAISVLQYSGRTASIGKEQQQPGGDKESSTAKQQEQQHPGGYNESSIVKFTDTLDKSHQTIVTAYFQVKSKHSSGSYRKWMKNILSVRDPMVIFLSPALIPEIKKLRSHALNRTVIIPMEIGDLPLAHIYNSSFWEHQLKIDRERDHHKNYHVFLIWLSKSWFVTEAIKHNFFQSDVFMWSDMGCFRNGKYNGKEVVQHPEQIPRNAMLFIAHHEPNPPKERIWNNKYGRNPHFFTSGSSFGGYFDTWIKFHQHFMETMQAFLDRNMFIGEDQTILQSTCMMHPDMCAYLPHRLIKGKDNAYFGLRYILHHGGTWKLWWPPALPSVDSAMSQP